MLKMVDFTNILPVAISILNFCREIITIATKTLAVKKMAMFAARNLLLVKELLLPTGKPSRAQQSTKMQRIMPW